MNNDIVVNMECHSLKVDNQGRILLPSWWRKLAGVRPSSELLVAVTAEGGLVIETREQGLTRARALVRKYVPEGALLSEELMAERREEGRREWER